MFTLAPAWATAIELGGSNSAVLSATMNTAGQIGGILSPIVLAYIVDRLGNWEHAITDPGWFVPGGFHLLDLHPSGKAAARVSIACRVVSRKVSVTIPIWPTATTASSASDWHSSPAGLILTRIWRKPSTASDKRQTKAPRLFACLSCSDLNTFAARRTLPYSTWRSRSRTVNGSHKQGRVRA